MGVAGIARRTACGGFPRTLAVSTRSGPSQATGSSWSWLRYAPAAPEGEPPPRTQAILAPKGGFMGMVGERGVGGSKCGSTAAVALIFKNKVPPLAWAALVFCTAVRQRSHCRGCWAARLAAPLQLPACRHALQRSCGPLFLPPPLPRRAAASC